MNAGFNQEKNFFCSNIVVKAVKNDHFLNKDHQKRFFYNQFKAEIVLILPFLKKFRLNEIQLYFNSYFSSKFRFIELPLNENFL